VSGRVLALAVAFVFAAGCSQLKQGRCNSHSDCHPPTTYCDTNDKVCIVPDAGVHHDASSDVQQDAAKDTPPPHCTAQSCASDPAKPFCDETSGMCRGCKSSGECQSLDAGTSVCDESDAGTGLCVQCTRSSDCQDPAASACVANVCGPCKADNDCAKFPPSVCKQPGAAGDAAPLPRRCAADNETIYVSRATGCLNDIPAADAGSTDAGVGGPASPFCSLQPVLNLITKTRNVIVITGTVAAGSWTYADQAKGPLLIVGKSNAKIVGADKPSFSMSSGTVTIRNVDFSQSVLSNGIEASGGMLTLDHVTVELSAAGGVLFDGASFDIENSTITNNGTGMDGLVTWSGIYVKTVTATGTYRLNQVTISNNGNVGLLCAGKVDGTGVLAFGNAGGVQIGSGCMVMSCASSLDAGASKTCGSQM